MVALIIILSTARKLQLCEDKARIWRGFLTNPFKKLDFASEGA
jgi:hypothetical protein